MFKHTLAALSCTLILSATPSLATIIGQPLVIAEDDGTGSILDFFSGLSPSGNKEVSASATVTQEFGTTGFIGETLSYSMDINGDGTLGIGTYNFDIFTYTGGFAGAFGDPLDETGLITTTFLVEFPIISSAFDPVAGVEVYTLDLDPFGAGQTLDLPEDGPVFPYVEIGVNIFYDGPLPTSFFDDGFGGFNYVAGAFTPTRIEVGLVGGAPISAVPLPATLPLVLAGLGALGLARRKSS